MSDLMLDVGQANELKLAFRRADWNNDDIKRLCEGNVLVDVRSVLRGHASIAVTQHVIDCDADPFNPWFNTVFTIEEHQKGGQWKFDPKQVEFFLASGQKDGKALEGKKLRKQLAKRIVFNANVLDYLLAHPELIPDEWKTIGNRRTRYTFFWGTIYRNRAGCPHVRYLFWSWLHGRWSWAHYWLNGGWGGSYPAAVRVD
jgi:hypothetical protein